MPSPTYAAAERDPHAGPRRSPPSTAKKLVSASGTGLIGMGSEMYAPAQQSAEKRQARAALARRPGVRFGMGPYTAVRRLMSSESLRDLIFGDLPCPDCPFALGCSLEEPFRWRSAKGLWW